MSAYALSDALVSVPGSYSPARPADTIPTIQRFPLEDGPAGTFQSLEAMAACVRGEIPPDFCGYNSKYSVRAAASLCDQSGEHMGSDVAALFDYCAHSLRYIPHPPDQQVIQDAQRTIEAGGGDCVSLSVLLATLLAARGYRPHFVAQWTSDTEQYSHVYCELGELALDPVASNYPMGWRQPLPDGAFETPFSIF